MVKKQLRLSDALSGKEVKHLLLKEFIAEFLPQSNYRRMYRYNEFSNVYYTLEKIFNRRLQIKIDRDELAECLNEEGYHYYITEKGYRGIKKVSLSLKAFMKPEGDFFRYGDDFLLFVNVNPKEVRYLERAMKSTSLQKNPTEIIRLRFLKRKINSFFTGHIFE